MMDEYITDFLLQMKKLKLIAGWGLEVSRRWLFVRRRGDRRRRDGPHRDGGRNARCRTRYSLSPPERQGPAFCVIFKQFVNRRIVSDQVGECAGNRATKAPLTAD